MKRLVQDKFANTKLLALCFAAGSLLLILFWFNNYIKIRDSYYKHKIEELSATITTINDSYQRSARIIYGEIVNNPQFEQIYRHANSADEAEQRKARQQLLHLFGPLYYRLQKENIRQLHFHLPDCTSFLRFHKPEKFGDNLAKVRRSVALANRTLEPVASFEEGRIINGFRYVFPIILHGRHLGSVEISLSFAAFKKELTRQFSRQFLFIIRKDIVCRKVFPSEQNHYRRCNLSDGYLVEKNARVSQLVAHINDKLKPYVADQLDRGDSFARTIRVENTPYLVAFYPIQNIASVQAAYIVSYAIDDTVSHFYTGFITNSIGSITMLFFVFFYIYSINSKNTRLQKAIETEQEIMAALQETEENFKRVFYSNNDAILLLDEDRFVDCNEIAVKMLNAENKQQIINIHPAQISPEVQPDGEYSLIKIAEIIAVAYREGFNRFEWQHKKFTGELFTVEVTFTLLHKQRKHMLHAVWKDVSERIHYQEKLRQAMETAQDASRSKTIFLANMSHDIRTPMNGIIGMTRLALGTRLDSQQRKLLNNVMLSAETLLGLLNDILDFSKIEAGQLTLQYSDFSLDSMLDHIVSSLGSLANDKGISLNYFIDKPDVPEFIRSDELRLRQILNNLVGNAIKFTDYGSVSVKVVRTQLFEDRMVLQFSIIDTGIGIPEDELKDIFKNFAQAEQSTTRQYGGTGLGLAISKQLVEMMGGDIWVESTPGSGSVFHFTIEVQEGTKTFKINTGTAQLATQRSQRILLVEDNKINQEVACAIFTQHNHRATVACNGLEALHMLARHDFDLVFMDVQMPEMDGITATSVIRACEQRRSCPVVSVDADLYATLTQRLAGRHIPIIAMTANAMYEDRSRCAEAGMDDYLTKPFLPEHVLHAISRFVAKQSDLAPMDRAKDFLTSTCQLPEQTVTRLLTVARADIDATIRHIRAALADNDYATIDLQIANLKTTLANIGLDNLVGDIKQMENAVAVDAGNAVNLVEQLLEVLDEF